MGVWKEDANGYYAKCKIDTIVDLPGIGLNQIRVEVLRNLEFWLESWRIFVNLFGKICEISTVKSFFLILTSKPRLLVLIKFETISPFLATFFLSCTQSYRLNWNIVNFGEEKNRRQCTAIFGFVFPNWIVVCINLFKLGYQKFSKC